MNLARLPLPRNIDWLLLATIGLALGLLSPSLATGYLDDDMANSLVPGMLEYHHQSLWDFTADIVKGHWASGRFFPLAFLWTYTTFTSITNLLAYKAFILGCVAVDICLFHAVIKRVIGNAAVAALSSLVAMVLVQFRTYHDPVLSYCGLMQTVLTLTLLSLFFLDKYCETNQPSWLFGSALAYLVSLLTYEVCYVFIVLHIAVAAYRISWRRLIIALSPFLVLILLGAGLEAFLRFAPGRATHPQNIPNHEWSTVCATLGEQLYAALPLSFFAADPAGLFTGHGWQSSFWLLALVFVPVSVLAATSLHSAARSDSERLRTGIRSALLGLLLWVLPGLLISLSPKYQKELRPGLGYLPVYIQYFGVGLLIALVLVWLVRGFAQKRLFATIAIGAGAVAIAVVASITFDANRRVAKAWSRPWFYDRLNIEKALQAGLVNSVPDGATVLVTSPRNLFGDNWRYLICRYGQKRLNTVFQPCPAEVSSERPVYEIKDRCLDKNRGWVFLSEIDSEKMGTGSGHDRQNIKISGGWPEPVPIFSQTLTRRSLLFVRDPGPGGQAKEGPFWVSGQYVTEDDADGKFFISSADLPTTRRGKGWQIFSVRSPSKQIDADSLEVHYACPTVEVQWGKGFFGLENAAGKSWRWCSQRGSLLILNGSCHAKSIRITMVVGGSDGPVTVTGPGFQEDVAAAQEGAHFSKVISVEPGLAGLLFTAHGHRVSAPQDPRTMYFRVSEFSLEDVAAH
jgi:hypothetical protein